MNPIALTQLQARFGGKVFGELNACFSAVSTDSRSIAEGEIFVALKGDNFDAHTFVPQVLSIKPVAVVVEKSWADEHAELLMLGSFWVVENTVDALANIATLAREAFTGPLIAVTGSCGKTTVKEMLLGIARQAFGLDRVLATQGNLNNHVGVPKTLFGIKPEHAIAIVEMGASGPNEIAHLVAMAKPTVAVVNNVMAAHVEGFGSLAGVAKAKSAIYEGLSSDGVAVINIDDAFAQQFVDLNTQRKTLTVSLNRTDADLFSSNVVLESDRISFTLVHRSIAYPVELPATGMHNVRNALVAAACALAAGMSIETVVDGLKNFIAAKGRMNISTPMPLVRLIDDTYNANPGSVRAAIDTLANFEGERWLVLGDMGELGADEKQLHADIGVYAKSAKLDGLITVGALSKFAAESFGSSFTFDSQALALDRVMELIKSQAGQITILIKGSRSARMELIVQAIADSKEKN